MAGVIGVGSWVVIDERAVEGAVDENGELARGGGDGLGLADAHGQSSVEGPEGGLAADETHGGDAQHAGGAVRRGLGFTAEPATAGDPVLRREGEPGGEVVFAGPARRGGADLGDQLENAVGGEAIDLREIDAGQVVECRTDVDVRFIAARRGVVGGATAAVSVWSSASRAASQARSWVWHMSKSSRFCWRTKRCSGR